LAQTTSMFSPVSYSAPHQGRTPKLIHFLITAVKSFKKLDPVCQSDPWKRELCWEEQACPVFRSQCDQGPML